MMEVTSEFHAETRVLVEMVNGVARHTPKTLLWMSFKRLGVSMLSGVEDKAL